MSRRIAGRFHSRALPVNTPTTTFYGPLLDQTNVPTALFAFGLRKLRAAYTGKAIQIYCNGSTFDVGFNADGSLNTSLIATNCGTNPGYISKLYDQSGNGYDYTARHPTSTTQMYRIWSGTALDTLTTSTGTIPCIKAINTNSDLVNTFPSQTGTVFSAALVAAIESTVTTINGRMLGLYGASATDSSDAEGLSFTRSGSSSPSASWSLARNPNGSGPIASMAGAYADPAQVMFVMDDTNGLTVYVENTAGTTVTGSQGAMAATNSALGYSGNTNASVGEFVEVVGFAAALTSTQRTAINTNQAGYWNTASASTNPSGGTGSGTGATNLPGWNLIFDENFATTAAEGQFLNVYGAKWGAYAAGTDDTFGANPTAYGGSSGQLHKSQYGTNNISVANNTMYLRLFVNSSGVAIGAAPIPKFPGASDAFHSGQTYFRYQFTMSCPNPIQGFKTAYLLWPDVNTWIAEDDFPEGNLNGNIGGFHHRANNTTVQDPLSLSPSKQFTTPHTFTAEWTAGNVIWYLDSIRVAHFTSGVASIPLHIIFQTETVLSNSGRPIAGQTCTVQISKVSIWLPS